MTADAIREIERREQEIVNEFKNKKHPKHGDGLAFVPTKSEHWLNAANVQL